MKQKERTAYVNQETYPSQNKESPAMTNEHWNEVYTWKHLM